MKRIGDSGRKEGVKRVAQVGGERNVIIQIYILLTCNAESKLG